MKGLVLAGGHGTRLRPLTSTGNKHMIPIANQPMLFYGLRQLGRAGVTEVGIILGPIQEGIRDLVGDGSALGIRVTYIEQGPPKGLAHAVQCARRFLGEEPFVMYLGDNLLEQGLEQFLDAFARTGADAVLGVTPVSDPHRYGIVELRGDEIVSIEEKPRVPRSNLALVGVYVFSPAIHKIIDGLTVSARGELEITDAIRGLHEAGGVVRIERVYGWWKDTGAPEDLLEANDLVLNSLPEDFFRIEGTVSPSARILGRVAIGKDSVVEAGSTVEGPAVIGAGVRLANGAVVGPGSSIGDRVELRQCEVRRSILLEGVRISGLLRIHDSLIGRNVEIRGVGAVPREANLILGDASRLRL